MEIKGIFRYNFKLTLDQKTMQYLISQQNCNDLKQEDSYDHYLFKSLIQDRPEHQQDYLDYLLKDDDLKNKPSQTQHHLKIDYFVHSTIQQLDQLISLRTTSIHQIITYLRQYFAIPKQAQKTILLQIRKKKMKLKRQYTKNKRFANKKKVEAQTNQVKGQIKIEDSTISVLSAEEQSLQTRKKKRNRMSAQNSRDRKKQYIRQMQNENSELRKRIQNLEQQNKFHHSNKDIIKLLLCLGITVIANINNEVNQNSTVPQQKFMGVNHFQIDQLQLQNIGQFIRLKDGQLANLMIRENIVKIQRQLRQKDNSMQPFNIKIQQPDDHPVQDNIKAQPGAQQNNLMMRQLKYLSRIRMDKEYIKYNKYNNK